MFSLRNIILITLWVGISKGSDEAGESLPARSRLNEEYIRTGSRCQSRCASYGLPCTTEADGGDTKPDWYCRNGYARLNWFGDCVPIYSLQCIKEWPDSPLTCSWRQNEVYGGKSFCGDDCNRIGVPCTIIPFIPIFGCTCKEGYARLNGKCIKKTDPRCSIQYLPSPTTCKRRPNEVFLSNGPTCQETCMWYNVPCDRKQTFAPVKGCYCKPGYIRVYESSDCEPIEIENCQRWIPSEESCKIRNEVYIEGGSPCQTNCATYGLKCLVTASKKVNACYCPDGYARISERGECVPVDSRECIDQMPVRRMN